MKQAIVTIKNRVGLHVRPASLLVGAAQKFDCKSMLEKGGKSCEINGVIGVMMLQCQLGDEVTFTCDGPEEEQCLNELILLVESKFGEE